MRKKRFILGAVIFWTLMVSVAHAASPVGRVRQIVCAPSNSDVVAAIIDKTVWMTQDGGENWMRFDVSWLASLSDNLPLDDTGDQLDFENDLDVYDAQDESEISDFEARRIEWEPSAVSVVSGMDTQIETNDEIRIHFAVSDDGTWVVSLRDRLVIGDQAGFRRFMKLHDIRGFVFDREGKFWVTHEDTLSLLGDVTRNSGETQKWRIPGASAPSLSPEGEILVPSVEGIWTFNQDQSALKLIRLGRVSAANFTAGAGRLVIATKGRIRLYCGNDYCDHDLPTPPPGIIQIETDESARVLVRSSTRGWFVFEGSSWIPMRVLALDVDGEKRIWVGTAFGPMLLKSNLSLSETFHPMDLVNVQFQAQQKLDVSPGPPPKCRLFPINPLPSARLFMGLNQGLTRWFETGTAFNTSYVHTNARRESELYFGLQLIWSLSPVDPSNCYLQRRNWRRFRAQKATEVDTLIRERHQILNTVPRAGDILETAQLLIEKKRNEELVKVLSNVQSLQEFEK